MGKKLKKQPLNQGGRLRVDSRDGGGSTQLEKVRASFEHFSSTCMARCDVNGLAGWLDKLRRLTSSTWQQVTAAPREGLGSETIPREQLTFAVPSTVTPDVTFLVFRCGGAARMIGYRDGAILHVLWFTQNHDAY